ncbi:MAG TPA: M20/M25/M40 family metallo-hydrolase, partial [Methylothermaceae bacterium]|nr:M20/M25/M40 family metallo-hydrolase [Methylothermaceae bacterium]
MSAAVTRRILHWLEGHQSELEELIGRLVSMETPSTVAQSQRPILRLLARTLTALDFRCRILPGKRTGGHLIAYPERRRPRLQLLLGHCDTVWPLGTLETMPLRRRDGRMYGPGIYDMKAGLAQMVFALRALKALDLTPQVTPVVLINSDEEIGSRES